ncbi:hypothetical protein ACFVKH_20015 [Almyronema epifaneia S1]|uniref:Uncharacterized protein n=2 Tax=Almyronema TaxID=3114804 RepID=A0ABW6ILZ9_9CYAN
MEAMSCFGDYYSGRQVTYPFESNGYSAFSGVIYSAIFRELADWDSKRITGWRDPEWKEFRPFPEKGWGTAVRVSGSFQCMDCGPGRQGQGVFAAAESQTDLVWIDIRKDSTYAPYLESEAAFQAFYEQERGKGQNKDPLFVGFPSGDYGCFKIICNTYPHQEPLPAPAYPPPEKPPMSCNCSEIEELLRGIYLRLGVDQYPVTVPESLTQKGNKTQELPDLTALAGWLTVQMDALMGQFPIEIEIEDDDLLKEGNQRRKVELPNLAETISELYALAYQSSVAGEIQINFLTRLTAELIATKNAAIITQDYARANASYLGYKGNPKRRKIRYAIDIEKSDKFTSLFNEVTKEVIGWEEDDPQTVAEYLQKLMYAAGIIKAAFMRKGNQAGGVIDGLRELFKGTNFDDGWQNFIEDLKNPDSIYNTGAIPKPDIVDTSPDALADILAELKKRNGTNNQP